MTEQTPWQQVSAGMGRNALPAVLFNALITDTLRHEKDIAEGLSHAWTASEWPAEAADDDVWLWAFEQSGYIVDGHVTPDEERPEKITLYRGAIESRALGMSWTASLEQARWFAGRFVGLRNTQPAHVYQIEATAGEILAHFTGRNEDEWVLDMSDISIEDLTVVETITERQIA